MFKLHDWPFYLMMLSILALIGVSNTVDAVGNICALNDTGITKCIESNGNFVACSEANTGDNALFPRQDARYGRDAQANAGKLSKVGQGMAGFDFTKIANDGSELPVTAKLGPNPKDWACTRDNVTGMIWEVKTDDGGNRDKDQRYTFNEAGNMVMMVNAAGLCGFNDWRIPTVNELTAIVNLGIKRPDPTIDVNYFPNTPAEWFWSITPGVGHESETRYISFAYGGDSLYNEEAPSTIAVRLVRAERCGINLVDNMDGTISDNATGLMWTKCSIGQTYSSGSCIGNISLLNWSQALKAAKDSKLAGYNDWRIPNLKELRSIVDYNHVNPNIDPDFFPNTPADYFWSSSPVAGSTLLSWGMYFNGGGDGWGNHNEGTNYAARLVRYLNRLSVNKTGSGTGTIISTPTGINCGAECNKNYSVGTKVILTAKADSGSIFVGWSGDCTGSALICTLTIDTMKNVTATFKSALSYTLIVSKNGSGNGKVSSNPAGINCSSDCNRSYTPNTAVTLTAVPVTGSSFAGWSGGCSGTETTCTLTMNSNKTVMATFNIIKAEQTINNISMNPTSLILGSTVKLIATATSGLPVIFSTKTPAICTVRDSTVTAKDIGTCMIAADQTGNNRYNAAPQKTQDIVVGKANQTINVLKFNPASLQVGGKTTVSADASSKLPITFITKTPLICSTSGTNGATVTAIIVGNCEIVANQSGNEKYNAAPQKTNTITISKGTQKISTITFNPTNVVVGGTTTVSATSSIEGLSVAFSSKTSLICSVSGNTITAKSAGNCVIAATQAGNDNYREAPQVVNNIMVGKATQTIGNITLNPASLNVGGTITVNATSSSGLTVKFNSITPSICSTTNINGAKVVGIKAGTCTIAANQAGNTNYNAAPQVTTSITVNSSSSAKNDQTISTITFNPTTLSVGGTATVSANASSGLQVTFSSMTPTVCTISGSNVTTLTIGTCTIAANQAGNTNYNAAPQVTTSITVANGNGSNSWSVAHNDFRHKLNTGAVINQPIPSPTIPDMTDDPILAQVAQNYAAKCTWSHNANRTTDYRVLGGSGYVGENLFISTGMGTPSMANVIESWFNEHADYNYANNSCSGVCGHYTQIAWRNSIKVGCATVLCPTVEGLSNFNNASLVVCNYSPGGNIVGQRPY